MYFKLIGAGVIALVIYLGYSFITGIIEDNATLKTNVGKLTIANDILAAERKKLRQDLKDNQVELDILNEEFKTSVKKRNKVVKIFSKHKFTMLFNKKSGLVIKLINKGTRKVFKELEDLSDAQ